MIKTCNTRPLSPDAAKYADAPMSPSPRRKQPNFGPAKSDVDIVCEELTGSVL